MKPSNQPKPESWLEIAREYWLKLADANTAEEEQDVILDSIERSHAAQPESKQEWTPALLSHLFDAECSPEEAIKRICAKHNADLAVERQRSEQVQCAIKDAERCAHEVIVEKHELEQQLLSALAAIEQLSSASFIHVSQNLAAMVTEYVESGTRAGTDWRNGLVEIISKRLKRLQLGNDIKADLSALREHDEKLAAKVRKPLVDALRRLHFGKDGVPIAWPSKEDVDALAKVKP